MNFLNKLDLCNKLKCSRGTIHNYVEEGLLPPAIYMKGKCKWFEHEIDRVMKLLAGGYESEQIKLEVKNMTALRAV